MEQQHRDAIQMNFSSLVEQTDLDLMVSALYEKGVFSDLMIEPYRDTSRDARTRKRQLYRDITRRGPDAFQNLLDALSENGYWTLVRELDPDNDLHTHTSRRVTIQPGQGKSKFVSISDTKKNPGKDKHDPNWNLAASSYLVQEHNGNAIADAAGPALDQQDQATAGIPQFNVIKSTKFYEDTGNDLKLYRTRGRRRGVLVLFSYIAFEFNIEEYREGARVDSDNLRYLFSELGFKVITYVNLSLEETKAALQCLKDGVCAEGTETMFVVFSSHGYARSNSGDIDIRCSDGKLISYYEIIEYFNNEKFPALKGIPKVFIFQTCRGSNKELGPAPQSLPAPAPAAAPARRTARDGRRYSSDGSVYESDDGDKARDRTYSDILIAHSTVPGYASNRDKVTGSWYIQALCDVFAARAHDCHVEKLFTLVDVRLRRLFSTQTSSVDRWGFNRRLYLHPGLYED